jgi:hypothetical protein
MADDKNVKCDDLAELVAPPDEGVQVHAGGIVRPRRKTELDEPVGPAAEGVQVHAGGIVRPAQR